jgi:dihydroorotase
VLNLPGGSLAPGANADVTILDLARELTIDPSGFHSKSRNTPFGGWRVTGMPWMTLIGGRVAMWERVIKGGIHR